MKGRTAHTALACLAVIPPAASAAASEVIERGDFANFGKQCAIPPWWWAVPAGAVLLIIAPVVFWKRRRGYAATVSLVLCVLVAFAWKQSYRGQEFLSVLHWRDNRDGAVYEDIKGVTSSARGIGLRSSVIWFHPSRYRRLTHAGTAPEIAEGPNPRLVLSQADMISYPGFRPERSVGLFPYQGITNPDVKTLAVEAWSKPPDMDYGVVPVASHGIVAPYWLLILLLSVPPFAPGGCDAGGRTPAASTGSKGEKYIKIGIFTSIDGSPPGLAGGH